MKECLKFYINGEWVDPIEPKTLDVINPATEEPCAKISIGSSKDVDKAVAAAKKAFETYSQVSVEDRIALLAKILEVYQSRYGEIAEAITMEMGAPAKLSQMAQAAMGVAHLGTTIEILKNYKFEEQKGTTTLRKEPIGVCGFITPWNWPMNQIMCKVAPALAAGCTIVLKPSEEAPLDAYILADIFHQAGVPKGVFNLVNGDGPGVGAAISSHPDIDMVSFTGSTRAGILVAKAAADTVKRVAQELGGKSPNIILDDADLQKAVTGGVLGVMQNSGQSCNAPTRMLVPAGKHDEALKIAKAAAESVKVGDPNAEGTTMGPVVNEVQFNKIQALIQKGIDEGATLVTGGTGRPEGLNKGFYVRPTVFGNVTNDMTIAREEIFGPVLAIMPYKTEEEAIRIANDTVYGLSGYVQGEPSHANKVAAQIRAGQIHVNGAGPDLNAPFGGYKQSGNGREWGPMGFEEYLETKAVLGANAA
ncbi:aldehyde dehydrogenase family protein [Parvibaculum sp.]|uniref:aldehyde dehydrogenase family protein n=1 Tax=Parvibaculum sp. TaxID=2024848 RepID=UPI000C6269CB|nr:aldehyde dehydrogenase family protein [Parvibaculum sp.]MAU59364.1 aldehyde dehydrogenase family protein [Parvibaculum sp.]MBO6668115.1 aldehyde dehydrogenase family protein [Parvibaculum sp.]MBO6692941.1 aldehyde dehydrogenase family protein [Parvibaculum sp.]MBO6715569.1 aldehyde dehydrogenase family protein [Parvibaculum sp.]|tara:strand:+ start:1473 stop:2900 length:1428 start_codon:yes stop_codon:yes gene_type:complete